MRWWGAQRVIGRDEGTEGNWGQLKRGGGGVERKAGKG